MAHNVKKIDLNTGNITLIYNTTDDRFFGISVFKVRVINPLI